jgi:membrane protease YdiL (CAAX protease family)
VLPELTPPVPDTPVVERAPLSRWRAAAEVFLCSGFPTQLAIVAVLAGLGVRPDPDGTLSPAFVFSLSAIDTVLMLVLILMFLARSNDSPRAVFLGEGFALGEVSAGVFLVPLVFMVVIALQLAIRAVAPTLHNVEVSPFAPFLSSPWLLAGFVVLVLVAGGVREEVQRAFLLHRFEQRLGGARLGLLLTSIAFGLGHTVQGWDAALVTGVLGVFWGTVYLTRRSVVATVTNHALFNLAQIAVGYATLTRT